MVSILKRSLQQPSALALAFSANRLARALSGTGSNARPSNPVCRKLGSTAAAAMSSTTVPHADLVEALRAVVPKLDNESYKGQAGKVGVMGGCREYTGAPFFAAMSALRMGCDLAYVFCTRDAAPVIKGYSPELIVLPVLVEERQAGKNTEEEDMDTNKIYQTLDDKLEDFRTDFEQWVSKMSVLVIGPGLGDDRYVGRCMYIAVEQAKERNLPVIIDGSGINFVVTLERGRMPPNHDNPSLLDLVKSYPNCILTPNIAEFGRLAEAVGVKLPGKIGTHWQDHAHELAAALKGPILVSKGPQDIISNGVMTLKVTADGSPRRCGGQGDILTGTAAAFLSWTLAHQRKQQQQQQDNTPTPAAAADVPPLMLAAYGGCLTMRAAAVTTFRDMGRSMVAGDMTQHLGDRVLDAAGLQPAGSCAPKL